MAFELAFAMVTAVVLACSAVVVVGLRLVLRKWGSLWRKALSIHALNIALSLVLLDKWPARDELVLVYSGFTHGAQLLLLLLVAAADITRASLHRKARPAYLSWAACAALVLAGIGLARVSVDADGARAAITRDKLVVAANVALRRPGPDRDIMLALHRDFPDDEQRVLGDYIILMEREHQQLGPGHLLERIPYGEVQAVEKRHLRFLAAAPDAALARVARANDALLRSMADVPDVCATLASHINRMSVAEAAQPANNDNAAGEFHAAMLDAERTGMDHPVSRAAAPDMLKHLMQRFAVSLTPEQRARWSRLVPATSPARDVCDLGVAFDGWLLSLPQADIAAYEAYYAGAAR